jgi:hypothetical protein
VVGVGRAAKSGGGKCGPSPVSRGMFIGTGRDGMV